MSEQRHAVGVRADRKPTRRLIGFAGEVLLIVLLCAIILATQAQVSTLQTQNGQLQSQLRVAHQETLEGLATIQRDTRTMERQLAALQRAQQQKGH